MAADDGIASTCRERGSGGEGTEQINIFYAHFENALAEAVLTANLSEEETSSISKSSEQLLLPHNRRTHTLYVHPSLLGIEKDSTKKSLAESMVESRVLKGGQLAPSVTKDAALSSSIFRLHAHNENNSIVTIETSHSTRALRNLQSVTQKCKYNSLCKGSVATRKCFSCVEYNPEQSGLFCERCFHERHPWYRVNHRWCMIAEAPDPQRDWLKEMEKVEQKREIELNQELQLHLKKSVRRRLRENEETSMTLKKRIGSAREQYRSMRSAVEKLITLNQPVRSKREEMARRIQRRWKVHKCRMTLRGYMNSIIKPLKDESTGRRYYVNTLTGKVSWQKPAFFGCKTFHGDKEAAIFIQRAWRRKRVRETVLDAFVANRFRRIWSAEHEKYYYLDLRSGATAWKKPKILGDRVLMTFDGISKIEAAVRMQRLFRRGRARRVVFELISKRFEKVWDENRRVFFYFNKATGKSSWTKPLLLRDSDIPPTPRSKRAAEARSGRVQAS